MGVRRDAHGEYEPDPYPDADDAGESVDEVIERHRDAAERHEPDILENDTSEDDTSD
jgi:predicted RNase H-like HicB family nuclease